MGEEPGQSAWTPPFLCVSCKQMDQSPSHIHSPAVPASDTAGPETSDTTGPETLHTTTCRPVSRWDCQPLTPQLSAGETVSPLPPNCQQVRLSAPYPPTVSRWDCQPLTPNCQRVRLSAPYPPTVKQNSMNWSYSFFPAHMRLGGTDVMLGGTDTMLGGTRCWTGQVWCWVGQLRCWVEQTRGWVGQMWCWVGGTRTSNVSVPQLMTQSMSPLLIGSFRMRARARHI